MQYVKQLIEERDALAAQIAGMAEQATTEQRGLTDSENASIDGMRARIDSLDTELRRWDGFGKAVKNFTRVEDAAVEQREARQAEQRTDRAAREARTVGDMFVESRAFTDYRGFGTSESVELPMLLVENRAPLLTSTDVGFVDLPQEVPGYGPRLALTLWDAITKYPVSQGNIIYPVFKASSDAAEVAEGTAKPEMTFVGPEMIEATLKKIAHNYAYSREFAADKSQIKAYVDSELRNGVLRKLNADAAATINGVSTTPVTGATLEEAIRLGIAQVEQVEDGAVADTLLVNPADAASLDLAAVGATVNGFAYAAPVWGLRIIKSNKVTAGKPIVLDLSAVKAYVREPVVVLQTDSHADYFVKNLLVAVAEARALTTVQRPELVVPVSAGAVAAARAK